MNEAWAATLEDLKRLRSALHAEKLGLLRTKQSAGAIDAADRAVIERALAEFLRG